MEDKRIQELFSELETYKQAIRDAQDALASCEKNWMKCLTPGIARS